jgi:hypothetical protein
MEDRKKEIVEIIPERGIVSMNGFRYWYEHIVSHKGDMCLSTNNPNKYCNGYYAYSPKDPGSGKCFVIVETDDPNVYDTTPVEVEESKRDSVVIHEGFDKPADSFGTSNNPSLIEKWRPMLESQGITDPYKQAWMADYCENHIKFDREREARGEKIIEDGVREIVGDKAADLMNESLSFIEPDSTSILESKEDAILFCETINNPPGPNDALKEAAKKYSEYLPKEKKQTDPRTKLEPVYSQDSTEKKLSWFRRFIKWLSK